MIKRYLNAALRSVTALLLSAVMAFGSSQYFAVNASAEEADMFCKVVYTTKYKSSLFAGKSEISTPFLRRKASIICSSLSPPSPSGVGILPFIKAFKSRG